MKFGGLSNSFLRNGVYIGKVLGIRFYLHATWFFIAAILVWTLSKSAFPALLPGVAPLVYFIMGGCGAFLFFVSILLHELGHSVVSQRRGIPVPRITLLFIGGVAEISREPDDARSELEIALGGPAVTVVLIAVCALAGWLFRSLRWQPSEIVANWLVAVNIALVLFNMIPGYPLDGGRVLRAILWARTGRLRWATFIASRIGIGFSWVLVAVGVFITAFMFQWNGFVFFLIALFLKSAAESGYANALQRELLSGVTVREIMSANPIWIPASMPLNLAVDEYFLANHHIAFPVGGDDAEFRGLLRIEFLKDVPRDRWPYTTAGDLVASRQQAAALSIEVGVPAASAMRQLLGPGLGRLVVTEAGKIVGMVTRHDILHFIRIHTELEV